MREINTSKQRNNGDARDKYLETQLVPIEEWGESDAENARESLLQRFGDSSSNTGSWWRESTAGAYRFQQYHGDAGSSMTRLGTTSFFRLVAVVVLVQFFFALNAIISRETVQSADPVIFSFIRDIGGTVVLMCAASLSKEGLVWPHSKDLWLFVAIGVGGVYLGQLFLNISMTYISAFNAMVLDALIPVFTLMFGHLLDIERIDCSLPYRQTQVWATLVTVLGAVLVITSQGWATKEGGVILDPAYGSSPPASAPSMAAVSEEFIIGHIFALAFALGGSTYPLLQKRVLSTTRMPPLSVAAFG